VCVQLVLFLFFNPFFFPSDHLRKLILNSLFYGAFYVFMFLGRNTIDFPLILYLIAFPPALFVIALPLLLVFAFLVFMYGLAFVAALCETVDC